MRREIAISAALLLLATLLAYVPAMRGGFIWDDDDYVIENETLRDLDGLRRIWLDPTATPQYYPLVHTSFWVEYQLWQLDPTPYHVNNVLIHVLNALLLWRLLSWFSVPGAWLAALVFAVHPVHVESVAWITERKNVLSGFFYLASALAFLKYWDFTQPTDAGDRPRWRWYAAAHLLFLGALLSKTVAATLPAALLVMLWWKRGRIEWRHVAVLLPMFVLGIGFGLLTVWLEKFQVGAVGADWDLSFIDRCLIAGRALWFYAGKLVWPVPLIFTYPRWEIDSAEAWQYVFPAAACAVVVALWSLRHRIGRGPLAGILFFAGTLVPALGFFDVYPMRFSFVADHFQYLASIGVIAVLVAAATQLVRRFDKANRIAWGLGTCLVVVLAALTWRQGMIYEGLETLWRDTLAKNPTAFMAHNNLGALLNRRGEYLEAEQHLREAVELNPDFVDAVINLGKSREGQGDIDGAMAQYRRAVELAPNFAPALNSLGAMHGAKGQWERAEHYLQKALRLDPDYAQAHSNLASVLTNQGDHEAAIAEYRTALRLDPELIVARSNLARVLISRGKFAEAEEQLERIAQQRPRDIGTLLNLGAVMANQKKYRTAIHYFERVLELDPGNPTALYNAAATYESVGEPQQAQQYRQAYQQTQSRGVPPSR